jgi:hypothetical protein
MKQIFICFEANKMVLFACFASKQNSKFYMRNEFDQKQIFASSEYFEVKCAEYFVKKPNIAKPTLKVHSPLPTVIAQCTRPTAHCPLATAHCLVQTAHCLRFPAQCLLSTVLCPLPTAHCPPPAVFTVYCFLSTAHYPLPTVHPLLTVHSG